MKENSFPDKPQSSKSEEEALRRLSGLLDAYWTIPGTNIRFGLDAVLGLIPGIGDFSGLVVSSYIIYSAAKLGVPTPVLIRMVFNVGVDVIVGALPFIGDVADLFWRSNLRNMQLFERAPRSGSGRTGKKVLVLLGLAMLALFALAIVGLVMMVRGIAALF